jgi:alpha-D-ribose 1-methylphosphonate 5-triphosphate synthase subunit PhnH
MLAAGFADPVLHGQRAFRAAMNALARPGRVIACGKGVPGDLRPGPAAVALLLGLCDGETTLHLAPSLEGDAGLAEYLVFHTGTRIVRDPAAAGFALLDALADPLDLDRFAQGTPEYPDRSTTIVLLVPDLDGGPPRTLSGPGIATIAELRASGLPEDFQTRWRRNRAGFPMGVDVIAAAPQAIVGLPRSVDIRDGVALPEVA